MVISKKEYGLMFKSIVLFFLISLSCFSATLPKITQKHLDSVVKYWQNILSLQDWEIKASVVHIPDLEPGTLGESLRNTPLRAMRIWVLDPQDYAQAAKEQGTVPKVGKEILRDIDDTILHEMVHLRLKELVQANDANLSDAEEVTVDRITSALEKIKNRKF
jgi:hypothetical protein